MTALSISFSASFSSQVFEMGLSRSWFLNKDDWHLFLAEGGNSEAETSSLFFLLTIQTSPVHNAMQDKEVVHMTMTHR